MKFKRIMLGIFATIVFLLVVFNIVGLLISAPKYQGPVSDHFNGKTFTNPRNVKAKGLKDVLKWASNRERQPWEEVTNVEAGPAPDLRVNAGIKLTFVNHSTFLIQVDGLNILTDPVWGERASPVSFAGPKRMRPPGIKFEDLPPIDIVLVSHNHYDHLDVGTMKRLIDKYNPKIVTPLGVGAFVEKLGGDAFLDMDWWQESDISSSIRIACVPAQHFSGRGTFDRDASLWCGYVLVREEGNIYFAGDSGYGDFFKDIGEKYGEMAVSLIPIGAYLPKWFMSPIHISPQEAVRVHKDVNSQFSIGMHFGTFPLADDGQRQPIIELQKSLAKEGILNSSFQVLEEGKSLFF